MEFVVQTQPIAQYSDEQTYLKAFKLMLKTRRLEEKMGSLFRAGKITGGVYLGKGHEAVSVTSALNLNKGTDVFAALIRDQGGRTTFGEPLIDMTRTYLGSGEGPMRGRDGNIHRGRPKEGLPAMISHLGTMVSLTVGMLMAKRFRGESDFVGVVNIGDGTMSTGSCHEGLNQAGVERLPFVALVANNQFAYSTPTSRQFACESLIDRAKGYGFEAHSVDGTSLEDCLKVIPAAVDRARSGAGPQMIEAKLLRLSGHGEHDDASYVPDQVRHSLVGQDCLEVARKAVIEKGIATEDDLTAWDKEASEEIEEAVAMATREKGPDPFGERWEAISSRHLIDSY